MDTPSRSTDTQPESGSQPPPAPASKSPTERPLSRLSDPLRGPESSQHMLAALSASSRAEASLTALMRAVREFSSGVSGAREANVQLLHELESMADMLGAANERQLALKNRVAYLEQSLERSHHEALRERNYILEQQDAFIAAMMEDHEQLVKELQRELEAARARPSQRPPTYPDLPSLAGAEQQQKLKDELEAAQATIQKLLSERDRSRETLLKLQAQRDEAQASVVELTRERDSARLGQSQSRLSDGVRHVIPATTTPPPGLRTATTLPPLETPQPVSTPPVDRSTRTTAPEPPGKRPRAPSLELSTREPVSHPSPPPEELRAALHPPSGGSLPAQSQPRSNGAATSSRHPRPFEKRSFTPPGPPVLTPSSPPQETPKPETKPRAGGYSLTNSVAPEHVTPGTPSRVPRR